MSQSIKYISASEAAEIDEILMDPNRGAFTLEQLMELAGLACAQATAKCYPLPQSKNVLVIAGPGNQGGDGLVCARHLWQFGYLPMLYYPKPGKNEFYQKLKKQLDNLDISEIQEKELDAAITKADVILDAIFGFSFKGDVRDPFKIVIDRLREQQGKTPIVSVDIPSAWDVDQGDLGKSFTPDVLVSLTAPKKGAQHFKGRHILGGRFVPAYIAEKYGLNLPTYPAFDQIVEL